MKKTFGVYSIIWTICLGLFNVFTFVTPHEIAGYTKFTSTFWVGYTLITVSFVGHLLCEFFALKPDKLSKTFYRLPLITISYFALVTHLVVGSVFMAIFFFKAWIGITICALVLGLNIISVVKAGAVGGIVETIDAKVKAQTFFIKNLTVKANELIETSKNPIIKATAEKVYDEIRYSDPISADSLIDVESGIHKQFKVFEGAIEADDVELVESSADELVMLIKRRNERCKVLKTI